MHGETVPSGPRRPRSPKGRARETARRLARSTPTRVALIHDNAFQLLAATILSPGQRRAGQKVTPALFAPTRRRTRWRERDREVEALIQTLGLFRNKAKSTGGDGRRPVDRYGEVPSAMEDPDHPPGRRAQDANVVRSVAWASGATVDTHVPG